MGYLSYIIGFLTCIRNPDEGQCQAGSLTGAVASKRVTEALEGLLRMIGNHSKSVKAKGGLTARATARAGTKVGLSDPVVISVNHTDLTTNATLAIPAFYPQKAIISLEV